MELGMAPLATIYIYDGSDPQITLTKEANDNLSDNISESYGWFPSVQEANSWHNQHVAMSLEGITYMEATGDNGTTFTGYYPNIDPEILQVGGTVATVDSNTGARITELSWSGSTGGWYDFAEPWNTLPSWMVGNGVPTNINRRLNPDIAMHSSGGNPFGGAYDFYLDGVLHGDFAGTSFASPVCAGCFAVMEGRLAAASLNPRLGRIQDIIYQQNGRSDVWFDIVSGPGNGILPNGQQGLPGPAWDFVTGWGAPDFDALYTSLVTSNTSTPNFPVAISTAIGTFIVGDTSSVAVSDNLYYQVGSVPLGNLGQAAGVFVTIDVPSDATFLTLNLQANADETGGTNMLWLFNWFTSGYDFIGAAPIDTATGKDRFIKVPTAAVPAYIGPNGEVDGIIRGHVPIRPIIGTMPNPFTYRLDLISLLSR
jgi:subtilase family serine protease